MQINVHLYIVYFYKNLATNDDIITIRGNLTYILIINEFSFGDIQAKIKNNGTEFVDHLSAQITNYKIDGMVFDNIDIVIILLYRPI